MSETDVYTTREVRESEITKDAHRPKWDRLVKASLALNPGRAKIFDFKKGKEDDARRAAASLSARLRRDHLRPDYLIVAPNKDKPRRLCVVHLAEASMPRLRRKIRPNVDAKARE